MKSTVYKIIMHGSELKNKFVSNTSSSSSSAKNNSRKNISNVYFHPLDIFTELPSVVQNNLNL